jgi:hypothetical protein
MLMPAFFISTDVTLRLPPLSSACEEILRDKEIETGKNIK